MPALVIRLKPALDQIADHRDQFIQSSALRRHFWIVADGDKCVLVPLNLKNELFLHAVSLAHDRNLDKGEAGAGKKTGATASQKILDELTARQQAVMPRRGRENKTAATVARSAF